MKLKGRRQSRNVTRASNNDFDEVQGTEKKRVLQPGAKAMGDVGGGQVARNMVNKAIAKTRTRQDGLRQGKFFSQLNSPVRTANKTSRTGIKGK